MSDCHNQKHVYQIVLHGATSILTVMSEFPSEAKSMQTEPGEVTSPPHPSSKKVDGLKRKGDINDSDEEDEDDEGDMLEEEEVRM